MFRSGETPVPSLGHDVRCPGSCRDKEYPDGVGDIPQPRHRGGGTLRCMAAYVSDLVDQGL